MTAYPEINAARVPKRYDNQSDLSRLSIFESLRIVAPNMAGIERMNENLAASSLSNPANIPTVIVVPERDIPGSIANA